MFNLETSSNTWWIESINVILGNSVVMSKYRKNENHQIFRTSLKERYTIIIQFGNNRSCASLLRWSAFVMFVASSGTQRCILAVNYTLGCHIRRQIQIQIESRKFSQHYIIRALRRGVADFNNFISYFIKFKTYCLEKFAEYIWLWGLRTNRKFPRSIRMVNYSSYKVWACLFHH